MPISTCANDIILAGHGSYEGDDSFILPDSVELHLLAPMGAGLLDGPVTALVGNWQIDRLALQKPSNEVLDLYPLNVPTVIGGGQRSPNLILEGLGFARAFVMAAVPRGASNVFTVDADTTLADLLARADVATTIDAFRTLRPKERVKIFWAAYGGRHAHSATASVVSCNALAVAQAAAARARQLADTDPRRQAAFDAAHAALGYAVAHPMDTAGAIAAASAFDAHSALLLRAF
ncbi:MAG: putative adhesin [Massilia sp.]